MGLLDGLPKNLKAEDLLPLLSNLDARLAALEGGMPQLAVEVDNLKARVFRPRKINIEPT